MAGSCEGLRKRFYPTRLSKVFLSSCLFGEDSVTENMYLESFLKYISKTEADLIERVLSNSVDTDDDDVLDFLSAFECKRLVTRAQYRE